MWWRRKFIVDVCESIVGGRDVWESPEDMTRLSWATGKGRREETRRPKVQKGKGWTTKMSGFYRKEPLVEG